MHTVEELQNRIRATESTMSDLADERAALVERTHATISEVDAALAPLDEEVQRGLSEGSKHAEQVRAQRAALLKRRQQAEQAVRDWDNSRGAERARLQSDLNDLSRNLAHARFDALTDADMAKSEKDARFRLSAARDGLNVARETLAHLRGRLAEAHDTVDAEADAVHALAELTGERERLQGEAFALDRAPEPAKLADVNSRIAEAETMLTEAQRQAGIARAAIGTLEGRISGQEAEVDAAIDRVKAAEGDVLAAVRNRAVRHLATLVDAIRDPLLTLEAVDSALGFTFYRALSERGLHTIRGNGEVVPPAWFPSPNYRPDSYADALRAKRAELLPSGEEL